MPDEKQTADNRQVGGNHYKDNFSIQPMKYLLVNRKVIGWAEGEIIVYVSRYPFKGGVEDLEKAGHILQALIETIKAEEAEEVTSNA